MATSPDPSNTPSTPSSPFPAEPGQLIKLSLRIAPDEHELRLPGGTLTLTFLQPTPPFVSAIAEPIKEVLPPNSPAGLEERIDRDLFFVTEEYNERVASEQDTWNRAHPPQSFSVIAAMQCDENGNVNLQGKIPNPGATELLLGQPPNTDAICKGVYLLQTPQFVYSFPTEPIIKLDDASLKIITAYKLQFSQDYLHRLPQPPPPPKTETISGLVIEPPHFEQAPQPPDHPMPPGGGPPSPPQPGGLTVQPVRHDSALYEVTLDEDLMLKAIDSRQPIAFTIEGRSFAATVNERRTNPNGPDTFNGDLAIAGGMNGLYRFAPRMQFVTVTDFANGLFQLPF